MGLLVPLKPGITALSPTAAQAGETLELEIQGYNTHFALAEDSLRAWLRLSENNRCTVIVK